MAEAACGWHRAVHNNRALELVITRNPDLDWRVGFLLLVPSEGRLGSRLPPPPTASPPTTAVGRHSPARSTAAARWPHRTCGAAARVRRSPGRSSSTHTPTTSSPSLTASAPARNQSSGTRWAGSSPFMAPPATPSESGGSSSSRAASCSASRPRRHPRSMTCSKPVVGPALERQRRVDRLVRHPHLRLVGKRPASQLEMCWGDQRNSSFASTTARSRQHVASFDALGRRARRRAARSARHAR